MRRAARTDSTASRLIAEARKCGCSYLPLNSVIDGLLLVGRSVLAVDWKSPGGDLTPAQSKLVAQGWPIHFVSTSEQLQVVIRLHRGRE